MTPYHAARILNPGEQRHAVVSAIHTLGSAAWPPDFALADGEAVLRGVVRTDVDRFAGQLVEDWPSDLCSEPRLAMRVLFDQADVRNLLLPSRGSATSRDVLLLGEEVRDKVG